MFETFRNRNFSLLWVAGLISFLGAIDAYSAAKRINAETLARREGVNGALLELFPVRSDRNLRPTDIPILQLRF